MSVARRQFMSTKKYVDFNLKMRLTYPKGHQTKFIADKQKNKIWFDLVIRLMIISGTL